MILYEKLYVEVQGQTQYKQTPRAHCTQCRRVLCGIGRMVSMDRTGKGTRGFGSTQIQLGCFL